MLDALVALGLPDLRDLCNQQVSVLISAITARCHEAAVPGTSAAVVGVSAAVPCTNAAVALPVTGTLSRTVLRAYMPLLLAMLPPDPMAR